MQTTFSITELVGDKNFIFFAFFSLYTFHLPTRGNYLNLATIWMKKNASMWYSSYLQQKPFLIKYCFIFQSCTNYLWAELLLTYRLILFGLISTIVALLHESLNSLLQISNSFIFAYKNIAWTGFKRTSDNLLLVWTQAEIFNMNLFPSTIIWK